MAETTEEVAEAGDEVLDEVNDEAAATTQEPDGNFQTFIVRIKIILLFTA